MYRALRVCSNRGGLEALPDPPFPIDLAKARRRLEAAGVAVVDARVMLIVALDPEVTVSRNGRLLFKTSDAELAQRAFERLTQLLALPVGPGPLARAERGARRPGERGLGT